MTIQPLRENTMAMASQSARILPELFFLFVINKTFLWSLLFALSLSERTALAAKGVRRNIFMVVNAHVFCGATTFADASSSTGEVPVDRDFRIASEGSPTC
jgi:hypothetical protein